MVESRVKMVGFKGNLKIKGKIKIKLKNYSIYEINC